MQSAVFRAPQLPEPEPEVLHTAQNHRPQMVRAPIASKAREGERGSISMDLAEKLRRQQDERMRAAIEYLSIPGVWSRSAEENMAHVQSVLRVTDTEVSIVFERAQKIMIKPALEFLALPVIRQQPVEAKVNYLRQKLGLHDEDICRAFERIKDADGVAFFAQHRVRAAVDFLRTPSIASKSADLKLEYLRTRLRLTELEIAEAYGAIAKEEREAEKARIIAEMETVGHAVLPNLLDEATRMQLMVALRNQLEDVSAS